MVVMTFLTMLDEESDKAAALCSHSLLKSFSLSLQTGRRHSHANLINSRMELSQLSDGLVRPSPPGRKKRVGAEERMTGLESEQQRKIVCKVNRPLKLWGVYR